MNDKEKMKNILREIKEKKFDEERILTDEEIRIIKMCEDEQYITSDSQSVIYLKGDNKFILVLSTRLREKGCDLLKGIDRNKTQPTQTFNVDTAYNSTFGNHSSVTENYLDAQVEDLKELNKKRKDN